ncbi:hypothetical protein CPB84DRAFT_1772287 [Gymnopilus junonius]|uniref:Uncharacterized protein n=1 Tax=Gymnopilus junonius TaxID=109634 RepID=A0A9P5NUF0_GYMJU|nr:hypothetical protein CPB84DRAFT_1772287 [Gymnopilus junonius]
MDLVASSVDRRLYMITSGFKLSSFLCSAILPRRNNPFLLLAGLLLFKSLYAFINTA